MEGCCHFMSSTKDGVTTLEQIPGLPEPTYDGPRRDVSFHSLAQDLSNLQARLQADHSSELRVLQDENKKLLYINAYLHQQLGDKHSFVESADEGMYENAMQTTRPFMERPPSRKPQQLLAISYAEAQNSSLQTDDTNEFHEGQRLEDIPIKFNSPPSTPRTMGTEKKRNSQELVAAMPSERSSREGISSVAISEVAQSIPLGREVTSMTSHSHARSETASRETAQSGHPQIRDSCESADNRLRVQAYGLARRNNAPGKKFPQYRSDDCRSHILRLVHNNYFEMFFAATIVANSVFLGIEVDHSVSHPDQLNPAVFYVIGYLFTTTFLVELLLRMTAYGAYFFYNDTCHWNYLDLLIVIASLVEVVADISYFTSDTGKQAVGVSNVRIVRIIRITRLIRIFRVARIVKLIRALRVLVYQIIGTLRSVLWAMVLLMIIIYVFAMVFAQAASEHVYDGVDLGGKVKQYWGSLPRSIFTLYKAIIGGVDWEVVVIPLSDIHWFWVFMFVAFISFTFFAVLNVITGVFCQSAIESAQHDQEMVIQQQIINKNMYTKKIRSLFKDIDEDSSDCITFREFERVLGEDKVKAYFESLGLDTSDAWGLFKLLDQDESHQIDIEEFVLGCLRLRGHAKAIDLAKISYDNKMLRNKLSTAMKQIEGMLQALLDIASPPASSREQTGASKDNGAANITIDRMRNEAILKKINHVQRY